MSSKLLLLLKRVMCVHCATHRARLSSSTFLTGQATNLSVSSVVVGSHSNIILLLSQANDVLAASQKKMEERKLLTHTHYSSSNQSIKQSPHFPPSPPLHSFLLLFILFYACLTLFVLAALTVITIVMYIYYGSKTELFRTNYIHL